jgi:adenylosuccinate lyase
VAFGHCLLACKSTLRGLRKVHVNRARLAEDLDGAWELLAEPVQTVLRKAGVPDAYERLKDMTRGRSVTREDLASFLRNAPISETDRRRLLALKPSAYTGLAARLVSRELPRTRRGAGRRRGRLQV